MWRFWPNCRGRDNYQVNKIGCGGKHTLDRFRRSTDEGCVGLACAVRPDPIGIEKKSGEASLLSRQGHAHVGRVGSDDGATLSAGVVAERVGRYTTPLWGSRTVTMPAIGPQGAGARQRMLNTDK